MLNFIAMDLQLYKIFKITQVSCLAHIRVDLPPIANYSRPILTISTHWHIIVFTEDEQLMSVYMAMTFGIRTSVDVDLV